MVGERHVGRRWRLAAVAAVCAAALAAGVVGKGAAPRAAVDATPPTGAGRAATQRAHPNAFFNPTLFYQGLEAARRSASGAGPVTASAAGRLAGGLVPHHDLAAELLSGFFLLLEEDPPEVIFLVGPNHEAAGPPVITGRRPWQTDFGLVEVDPGAVDALVGLGLAAVEEDVLAREHAMGTLMPYIKFHAPEARVVPLILHRGLSRADLERLAGALAAELGPGRILVASVDFSHYLTRPEAEAMDRETLATITAGDLDRLLQMGPEHLDSPGSVAVLLTAMAAAGADGPTVLGHTNSGAILRDDLIETTSYFTFVFTHR